MKYLFTSFFLFAFFLSVCGQSIDLMQFDEPLNGCGSCIFGNYNYRTGSSIGFGYGLVKDLSPKFQFVSSLGLNIWMLRIESLDDNDQVLGSTKKYFGYLNFSNGCRYKLLNSNNFNVYTGLRMNTQFYMLRYHKNVEFSIEPHIGMLKNVGKMHEFHISVGLDQHFTSFNQSFKRYPNKVILSFGYNLNIDKYFEMNKQK